MPRLRRSDPSLPGLGRCRRGRGFSYHQPDGTRVEDVETLARIRALGIPPAWRDVWICPDPNGHLQATGYDAAGRKQYLYHPVWRERRDQQKFDAMVRFARALPALRRRVRRDLDAADELTRERVLACAVRLLERGFFRIGSEGYAEENDTYGLATMRKEHVSIEDEGTMLFDYPAKNGRRTVRAVVDPACCAIVARLQRRRGGGPELLAWRERRAWVDVRSSDINAYLKEISGGDHSAKDFRTWNATVLCAVALGVSGAVADTKTGRKRAIVRALQETAHYLGNTSSVCRASYVDPRVIDAYHGGLVIAPQRVGDQRAIEAAVLDLIERDGSSPALQQVA